MPFQRLMTYSLFLTYPFLLTGCVMAMMNTEEINRARDDGLPILVVNSETTGPDSAGGVSAKIAYYNLGDKPLKYVRFTVIPYNDVGDKQISDIGGGSRRELKDTGPIKT